MPISIFQHEPGCTPYKRCQACAAADLLREKLSETDFAQYVALLRSDEESPAGSATELARRARARPALPASPAPKRPRQARKPRQKKPKVDAAPLETPLETLSMKPFTISRLKKGNLLTIGDVAKLSPAKISKLVGAFGKASLDDLQSNLASVGHALRKNRTPRKK